jgi:hypothetical protein
MVVVVVVVVVVAVVVVVVVVVVEVVNAEISMFYKIVFNLVIQFQVS